MTTSRDAVARSLGWFSLGLGAIELLAPGRLARALGAPGWEGLIRAYGGREVASGLTILASNHEAGLWTRVAGDTLDLATLMALLRHDNRQRTNVILALLLVAGITALDVATAQALRARRNAVPTARLADRDRSGFPRGLGRARTPQSAPAG